MLFSSYVFIFAFLPLVWAGFHALKAYHYDIAKAFLIAASLVFYGYFKLSYLLILFASIIVNYGFGRFILSTKRERERTGFGAIRAYLWHNL